MAASLTIEHEQGTYLGPIRGKHQGYYAGDFSLRHAQPGDSNGGNQPVEPRTSWT